MAGWEQTHRRYRLVYAVADDVVRRGNIALTSWTATIEAEYGTMETFRLDVRRRWNMAVDAQLDDASGRTLAEIYAYVAKANGPLFALVSALQTPQPVPAAT